MIFPEFSSVKSALRSMLPIVPKNDTLSCVFIVPDPKKLRAEFFATGMHTAVRVIVDADVRDGEEPVVLTRADAEALSKITGAGVGDRTAELVPGTFRFTDDDTVRDLEQLDSDHERETAKCWVLRDRLRAQEPDLVSELPVSVSLEEMVAISASAKAHLAHSSVMLHHVLDNPRMMRVTLFEDDDRWIATTMRPRL